MTMTRYDAKKALLVKSEDTRLSDPMLKLSGSSSPRKYWATATMQSMNVNHSNAENKKPTLFLVGKSDEPAKKKTTQETQNASACQV